MVLSEILETRLCNPVTTPSTTVGVLSSTTGVFVTSFAFGTSFLTATSILGLLTDVASILGIVHQLKVLS